MKYLLFLLLGLNLVTNAQIAPLAASTYRDNPLTLTYTFSGLSQPPVLTAVVKKDANGLPLTSDKQPTVSVMVDPVTAGQYIATVSYISTSNLPVNSYLEIRLDGQTFAAGPLIVDRSTRSGGNYTTFVNTITLLKAGGGNGGTGGGSVDLTGVYAQLGTLTTKSNSLSTTQSAFANTLSNLAQQIANLPTTGGVSSWTALTDKPALFSGSYADLTNKPSTFAPSTHTHLASDITPDAAHRFVSDAQIAGWNSSTGSGFSGNYADLIGKPTLFSGNYADLTNKPTIPAAFSGSYLDLTNRPTLFSGSYTDLTNKPTIPAAFSGSYLDLTNKPTLFSGNYNDLQGKPSLFSGSYLNLTNLPAFSNVASTGSYNDLINRPSLFSGDYNDLINKPTIPAAFSGSYLDLSNRPSLSTVATSGSYTDLINRPTLFSGSYADLTNKPTLFSGSYTDLSNKPTIPSVPTTVSSFSNDALYRNTNQVAAQIKDSLTSNTVTFSGDFVKTGGTIALFQPYSGTAVDQSIIANSTNPVSGGAVQTALAGKAAASHTQTASTISDFNSAIATYLQGLSGFGTGTVLSNNLTWVSAGTGTALTQLAAPVLSIGTATTVALPLTWTTIPNAVTYVVTQAIDPQFSNGTFDVYTGAATSYANSGLNSGQTYYYRIKAKASGFADSDYGFNLGTTTGAAPGQLATPSVTVGSATTATLTASWGAITNATAYSVTIATNSALTTGASSLTTAALSYTATGLAPSTQYYVGVMAMGAGFTNSSVGIASGTTSTTGTSTTALSAPTLTFSGVSSSAATANWTNITNASGYIFQRADDAAMSTNVVSTTLGAVTTTSLTGLTSSKTYYGRVMALGTGNYTNSPYSTTATFTTSSTATSTTALAQVTNLNSNGVTTTAITTAWVSVTNATSYQVELSTNNFSSVLTTTNSGTATYATFTGLTAGTLYYVRVKALGSGSYTDGAYSTIISRTTTASQAGTYAVSRTWKVNFSTSSNATAVTNWVTLGVANASITTGYSSASLTTSDGTASTLSVSIVAGFSGGSVAIFAATAPTQNGVWPDLVLNRGWSFPNATSTIAINGLDPSKNYNLFLPAAAPSSGTQGYLSVTATGTTSQTSGIKYMPGNVGVGSASDTDSPALLNVYNITPTAAGTITYTMGRFSGSNSSWQSQGFILQESNIVK